MSSFNTGSGFNTGVGFNGNRFNTGSIFNVKPKPNSPSKPTPTTKLRTATVNKCGYVVLSSTASYPLSKLVAVNGISRSNIMPIAFTPSGKEKKPSCKVGSYGMQMQSRHFTHGGKLHVFALPAGPGAKVKVVYDK